MLDLYSSSTEEFIADYYTRTDRLKSRRSKLRIASLVLAVFLPVIFIAHLTFTHISGPKVGNIRPISRAPSKAYTPLTPYRWQNHVYRRSPVNSTPVTAPVVDTSSGEKIRRFPGDPNPMLYQKAYWGSSIGGNGDPKRHESVTDTSLSIRRTFWQWKAATSDNSNGLYKTIEADLAANRLPFISIKTPGWEAVANGSHDTELDAILTRLNSYNKPIWLAIHHEPEGGSGSNKPDDPGGAAAWRAVQKHVRDRMNDLGTKNIAFMPILMSYTWNPGSGRNPDDWWVPGIWDAYIVDHYHNNEKGDMFSSGQWDNFVTWIEKKGLPYGTGEWGNRGTNADAANEMQAFWDWSFDNKKDIIAYTYFDSGLNSPSGSWELTGQPLTKFHDILKNDPKVQRLSDL